jgi:hypothetical protein
MKNTERWRIEKETREAIKNLIRTNSSVKENSKSILSLLMSSFKIKDGREETLGVELSRIL